MDRWGFSNKLPSTLEKSRKIAACDPMIIYDFYDILEKTMKKLKIEDRPGCVWNVDESNLYIDPQKEKVVLFNNNWFYYRAKWLFFTMFLMN